MDKRELMMITENEITPLNILDERFTEYQATEVMKSMSSQELDMLISHLVDSNGLKESRKYLLHEISKYKTDSKDKKKDILRYSFLLDKISKIYIFENQYEDAAYYLKELLSVKQKIFGEYSIQVSAVCKSLVGILQKINKPIEAAKMLEMSADIDIAIENHRGLDPSVRYLEVASLYMEGDDLENVFRIYFYAMMSAEEQYSWHLMKPRNFPKSILPKWPNRYKMKIKKNYDPKRCKVLALLYVRIGETDQAVRYLDEVLKASVDDKKYFYRLKAEVLEDLGRLDEALQNYY